MRQDLYEEVRRLKAMELSDETIAVMMAKADIELELEDADYETTSRLLKNRGRDEILKRAKVFLDEVIPEAMR